MRPDGPLGRPGRRGDLIRRARGETRFTDDLRLPRMLCAKLVRSPHAHARIVRVDLAPALALPGVISGITGDELPERFGIIPWTPDEHALARGTVRFVGDAVAAVAALDERTAARAAESVRVTYAPLPSITTLEDAVARPEVGLGGSRKDNVSKSVDLAFGDVDEGLAGADVVVEGAYEFHGSAHAPIETHCALAQYDGDGLLTVWSTTQVPHYLHRELSRVLGVSPARIRVVQPPLGGAFGGKSEPFGHEMVAAKLAMKTGRPVKILLTREEEFYVHRGRHPMQMKVRAGARADGTLAAYDARTVIDGGAYSSFGLVTTYYSGQLLSIPTVPQRYRFSSTRYFTNKPPCGPKRGHGSVQPRFAFEVTLDKLAERLGIDPFALRRRNVASPETTTLNGMRVTSNGMLECLARVEEASGWKTRRGRLGPGRGLGLATSAYISGTNYPIYPNEMPQSAVQLKVDRSGVVTVFNGASELGQGTDTLLASIVAEELGLDLRAVRVVSADTDLCPVDLGAYSSRGTFMNGNACASAARQVRERLVLAVAEKLGVAATDVFVSQGFLCTKGDGRAVPVDEAIRLAEAKFGTLGAVGYYRSPPSLGGAYRGGTIGASPAYSFTAHVAEVRVDRETGVVEVVKVWCAHDCGRALLPTQVVGQIEGSVYMGVAEALFEEHAVDAGGRHRGPNLLDYRIPTSLDVPDIESLVVESMDPEGPYGAKEAGEGPLHSSIPAVVNAVYDAIGARIDSLPLSPARVLAALRAKERC